VYISQSYKSSDVTLFHFK